MSCLPGQNSLTGPSSKCCVPVMQVTHLTSWTDLSHKGLMISTGQAMMLTIDQRLCRHSKACISQSSMTPAQTYTCRNIDDDSEATAMT